MIIGVPKEIKVHEHRIVLTPSSVQELVKRGHTVLIESNLGLYLDITDKQYKAVGATIVPDQDEIFSKVELAVANSIVNLPFMNNKEAILKTSSVKGI